jgi:hypothetical protein
MRKMKAALYDIPDKMQAALKAESRARQMNAARMRVRAGNLIAAALVPEPGKELDWKRIPGMTMTADTPPCFVFNPEPLLQQKEVSCEGWKQDMEHITQQLEGTSGLEVRWDAEKNSFFFYLAGAVKSESLRENSKNSATPPLQPPAQPPRSGRNSSEPVPVICMVAQCSSRREKPKEQELKEDSAEDPGVAGTEAPSSASHS